MCYTCVRDSREVLAYIIVRFKACYQFKFIYQFNRVVIKTSRVLSGELYKFVDKLS